MIKLVHSYLTKNYIVTKGVDGDYLVYYINTNPLELVYWFKLSTELTSIFSLDEEEIKLLVSHWAYSINEEANLKVYFETAPLSFPSVTRVVASLMSNDLVSVQPMAAPRGELFYMDYQYSGDTPNRNGRVYSGETLNRWNQALNQLIQNPENDEHIRGVLNHNERNIRLFGNSENN